MSKLISGVNDLVTLYPDVAKEWNYTKNGNLDPHKLFPCAAKTVWFKCSVCGHEWSTTLSNRTHGNHGCPACAWKQNGINHAKPKPGQSFADKYPDKALDWDYKKNDGLKPTDIKATSGKKVWWKCHVCGKTWKTSIAVQVKRNECTHFKTRRYTVAKPGKSLADLNPGAAIYWDYKKNGSITPDKVRPNSALKVWCKCKHGHTWRTRVSVLNAGYGCKKCSNRQRSFHKPPIEKSLAMRFHDTANAWNYKKNINLKPTDVRPYSSLKVWWKCPKCGYEWQDSIVDRIHGRACPKCSPRNHQSISSRASQRRVN